MKLVFDRETSVLALTASDGEALRHDLAIEQHECDRQLIAALDANLPARGTLIGFEVLG